MVKETDQLIATYIESGDYYSDARSWYDYKYLAMTSQNAIVKAIIVLIGIAFLGMIYMYSLNVVSKKYPFPIYSYDETQYFPHIKPLAYQKEPISLSVSRYLVKKYVEFRESYEYSNYSGEEKDVQVQKVKSFSSRKVFRQYLDYIDPESNPSSPLVLYKLHTIKKITITDVKFLSANEAEVYYTATIINKRDYNSKQDNDNATKWKSNVSFRLSDIANVLTKKQKLNFIVTDYITNKL